MDLFSILIGRRLANEEGRARKITAIEGVPAMGLDGLASSAYGPEAALTIFIPLGAEGLHLIRPIMAAILVLFEIFVGAGNDSDFLKFCELLDMPDIASDPRFATNSARVVPGCSDQR